MRLKDVTRYNAQTTLLDCVIFIRLELGSALNIRHKMTFPNAVLSAFFNYANFSSRSSRSEYWWYVLFLAIASFMAIMIDGMIGTPVTDPLRTTFWEALGASPLNALLTVVTFIPSLSVLTRRLHDIGRSGWNQLWIFTLIGVIPLLYWLCKKGDSGSNKFGSDPLV